MATNEDGEITIQVLNIKGRKRLIVRNHTASPLTPEDWNSVAFAASGLEDMALTRPEEENAYGD